MMLMIMSRMMSTIRMSSSMIGIIFRIEMKSLEGFVEKGGGFISLNVCRAFAEKGGELCIVHWRRSRSIRHTFQRIVSLLGSKCVHIYIYIYI